MIVALVPSNYGAVPVAEGGPVTAQQTLLGGTVLLWVGGLNAAFQALQFWWRRRVEPFKRSLRRTVTYTAIHVGLLVLLAVLWGGLGYIRAVHFTAAIAVVAAWC